MDPRGPRSPDAFRVRFTRQTGRSAGVPALLAQFVVLLIILGLIALGLIIFIPLAIIATAAFLITLGVMWVRVKLFRARQPNGSLDGRRNVRVVRRGE